MIESDRWIVWGVLACNLVNLGDAAVNANLWGIALWFVLGLATFLALWRTRRPNVSQRE